MSQLESRNRLLTMLAPEDRALLAPHLMSVSLDIRFRVEQPGEPIPFVYFMERGIVSVVACTDTEHRCIEAGLVGREGMTGALVVLGGDRSPNRSDVQAAGSALRVDSDHLRRAMETSPNLKGLLIRYAQAFFIQVSHTALANGTARIEERLARWLLMAQDRIGGDELNLTHEFMSTMLGVRRPGVTDTIHQLEGRGLIRSTRGTVRIIDREGLIAVADGLYGVPEAEYERLLG